jgi:hypothetical protein
MMDGFSLLTCVCGICRTDDREREEDLRSHGPEDKSVEVLDARRLGFELDKSGETGRTDYVGSHGPNHRHRTLGLPEKVGTCHGLRYRQCPLGLHAGKNQLLIPFPNILSS